MPHTDGNSAPTKLYNHALGKTETSDPFSTLLRRQISSLAFTSWYFRIARVLCLLVTSPSYI
jgi:hypothetical protein